MGLLNEWLLYPGGVWFGDESVNLSLYFQEPSALIGPLLKQTVSYMLYTDDRTSRKSFSMRTAAGHW